MQLMSTSTHRRWLTLLTTILLLLSQTTTVFAAAPIEIRQAGSNNDTPAEDGTLSDAEAQPTEAQVCSRSMWPVKRKPAMHAC